MTEKDKVTMRAEGSDPHASPFEDGSIQMKYIDGNGHLVTVSLGKEDYALGKYGVVWNVGAKSQVLTPWIFVREIMVHDRNTYLGEDV